MITEKQFLEDEDMRRNAPPVLYKLRLLMVTKQRDACRGRRNPTQVGVDMKVMTEIDDMLQRLIDGCRGVEAAPKRPRLKTTID
jgi:hypothetical protein